LPACRVIVKIAGIILECTHSPGYLEVRTAGDEHTCPACREISGKKYTQLDAPWIPYPKCTSEVGCRCVLRPCKRKEKR
jgi:hypothetical protein